MTTEKIRSFWRPLAIFLFVALIGTVLWMITRSAPPSDHDGNTEMGDDSPRAPAFFDCVYRNISDKSSATLIYTGELTYSGDYAGRSYNDIEIMPSIYNDSGSPLPTTNVSVNYSVSVGVIDVKDPSDPYGGIAITSCDFNGTNSTCEFVIKITISNLLPGAQNFTVKFLFPYGGYQDDLNHTHPPEEQELVLDVKICPFPDLSSLSGPDELIPGIVDEISGTFPEKPIGENPSSDWPKYQIFNNEGVITLIPYFEDDFNKENQE